MKTFTRTLAGTLAAGALAVSSAAPAVARDRSGGGIDAGDVIAGALVIGGIAAVASAASDGGRDRYAYGRAGYGDRYGYDRSGYGGSHGYDRGGGNPRQAVERCVREAEQTAGRYSRGHADVTYIRSVRDTRYGYKVVGRIAVNSSGRVWRTGDRAYGNGWNGDYRGWNSNLRGYDAGSFECRVEQGRVVDLDFNGIRGL